MKLSGYFATSDGQRIHYDRYLEGHNKLLIIAHGFFNSKQAVLLQELAYALNKDFDVLVFDFRGHGLSEGWFYWTAKEYLDLLAAVDFAANFYESIGVIGFSLGGATSIIASAKTSRIQSILSVSAPSEFEKINYKFWKFDVRNDLLFNWFGKGRVGKGVRPGPFWKKKERPIDIVPDTKIPIFYIHGDKDWLIDPQHAHELYERTSSFKQLNIIRKGPHAENLLRHYRREMVDLIRRWFHETLY